MSVTQNIPYLISKVGDINPSTRSKLIEIIKAANKAGHKVRFAWGKSNEGEHKTGNAIDIMVNDEAAGDWIRNYTWANRRRLGLEHVIWEQHITSTKVQPGVRRKMPGRGSPTENHYDHNHIKFLNANPYVAPTAAAKPPAPTKKPPVVKPKKKVRNLRRGMHGNDVRNLQKGLKRAFPKYSGRIAVDGDFGPNTEREVREFQQRAGLKVDGVVGPNTRAALRKRGVNI